MATDDTQAVLDKIAELPEFSDVAQRLHELIVAAAPQLKPRLWYSMPGYALAKKSPVLVFFRVDNNGYVTLGLSEHAHHEPSAELGHLLMASSWFLTDIDAATEAAITDIVVRATTTTEGD